MMRAEKIINEILRDVKQKDDKYILKNRLDFSDNSLKNWKKNANFAKKKLEDNNIDYCLIKGYDIPHAIMDDVDILVEDNLVLKKLFLNLKKGGFFFKHITFNDELKVSAIHKQSNIEIDFYPDAKWGELRYARKGDISKSKKTKMKHEIEFPIPNSEYEIYIVATHSYYHGRINLLEILNTIKIIIEEKPSIQNIIDMSKKFHMQNGLLALLSISKKIMNDYGIEELNNNELDQLKSISNSRFRDISEKRITINQLPWKFSTVDLILSSISKFNAKNLDTDSKKFDELSGFIKHNSFSNFFYSKLSKNYNEYSPI